MGCIVISAQRIDGVTVYASRICDTPWEPTRFITLEGFDFITSDGEEFIVR